MMARLLSAACIVTGTARAAQITIESGGAIVMESSGGGSASALSELMAKVQSLEDRLAQTEAALESEVKLGFERDHQIHRLKGSTTLPPAPPLPPMPPPPPHPPSTPGFNLIGSEVAAGTNGYLSGPSSELSLPSDFEVRLEYYITGVSGSWGSLIHIVEAGAGSYNQKVSPFAIFTSPGAKTFAILAGHTSSKIAQESYCDGWGAGAWESLRVVVKGNTASAYFRGSESASCTWSSTGSERKDYSAGELAVYVSDPWYSPPPGAKVRNVVVAV